MSQPPETASPIADRARRFAPVVWLIGKVQSGKSSIVRVLTQSTEAEVGSGFRACTRMARVFDFPQDAPIIRFLDTRGLGEATYDPAEDIAFCEGRSHLILAVAKAMDQQQQVVLDVIAAARRAHPDWPVVVAQTSLHEGYPHGTGHTLPYPFADGAIGGDLPAPLAQALAYQRGLFSSLPGRGGVSFASIDFTHAGDGFEPADYGREALIAALIAAAPLTVATALAELPQSPEARRKSDAHILGYAMAAGAGDAVPIAGAVLVPAVQAAMLHQLARLHGVQWQKRDYAEFAGALGAGTLIRMGSSFGIRQLVKLIPVYGQTAGAAAAAAASFATTYAMGKAATFYLARRRQGVTAAEVSRVYREALRDAFRKAKERELAATGPGAKAS
jgi:uncharacterized protein (DUF697 family)